MQRAPLSATTAPGSVLERTLFPGSTTRFLLFTLNRLAASNALAALRLRNILPGVLQATLTSHRSLISNLKSGGPHTLRRCQPHRPGSRHQNACAVAPYSGYRQHRRRNLARPGGEVLQGRDHRRQRFNCCVRWQKGRCRLGVICSHQRTSCPCPCPSKSRHRLAQYDVARCNVLCRRYVKSVS